MNSAQGLVTLLFTPKLAKYIIVGRLYNTSGILDEVSIAINDNTNSIGYTSK